MDLDLRHNALDFLREGFERFEKIKSSEENKKYAVLNVSSGVLLALKVPLAETHWTLLFADVNKATTANLKSGDFYGINFKETIDRLKNICEIDVSTHSGTLRELAKKRNEIEHFQCSLTDEIAESLLAASGDFVLDFIDEHLTNLDEKSVKKVLILRDQVSSIKSVIKKRLARLEPEIQRLLTEMQVILRCPECSELTLPLEEEPSCLNCRNMWGLGELLQDWVSRFDYRDPKNQSIDEFTVMCPTCDREGLLWVNDECRAPKDLAAFCLCCAEKFRTGCLHDCSDCGRPMSDPESEDSYCSECWQSRLQE